MEYQIYNNGKVTRIELATSEISSGGQGRIFKIQNPGFFHGYCAKIYKDANHASSNRENIEYDIDGVVVKPEVIDYEDLKNRTPKNSCAIKFELDVAVTTVIGFEWSQSGKYFSPVAILEPVELCGVTVKRASCSNTKWLAERNIEIGSKVKVVRRGEIIPHIEGLADE